MSFDVRPTDTSGTYDASGRLSRPRGRGGRGTRSRADLRARAGARLRDARRRRRRTPTASPTRSGTGRRRRAPGRVARAEGKRMMFDTDRLSGRVVASLLHPDGASRPRRPRRRGAAARPPARPARGGGRMTGIQLTGLASGAGHRVDHLAAHGRGAAAADGHLQQAGVGAGAPDGAAGHPGQAALLKTATTALSSVTTWGNSQTVESTDTTKATVRTVAGASPGGHQLVVSQLARGAQATYAYSAPGPRDGQRRRASTSPPARASTTRSPRSTTPTTPTAGACSPSTSTASSRSPPAPPARRARRS